MRVCGQTAHVPLGGSTKGARRSWQRASHQEGSGSVTMPPVAERVVCPMVAAPMASPSPVTLGGRRPSPPVGSNGWCVNGFGGRGMFLQAPPWEENPA